MSGAASNSRPLRVIELNLWAVYRHPLRTTNSVSKPAEPLANQATLCLPNKRAGEYAVARYDRSARAWRPLERVAGEHEQHVCGLTDGFGLFGFAKVEEPETN